MALIVVTVKRQERTAMGNRRMQHLRSGDELIAVDKSDEWPLPVKCLERFGNVLRNCNVMSCTNECLRDALEQRGVCTNDEN